MIDVVVVDESKVRRTLVVLRVIRRELCIQSELGTIVGVDPEISLPTAGCRCTVFSHDRAYKFYEQAMQSGGNEAINCASAQSRIISQYNLQLSIGLM